MGHVKDFLPVRGMKPKDLGSFLGWFMWWRYSRQRDLDLFVHFLKCAAEIRPPSHFSKLPFATAQTLNERKNSNSDEDFLMTLFEKPFDASYSICAYGRCVYIST